MDEQKVYVVGGIAFTDAQQAKRASIEQKRIEILNEKLDYRDVEAVAKIYEKACENRTFQTPIGVGYMVRLHDWLVKNRYDRIKNKYVIVDYDPAQMPLEHSEEFQSKIKERDMLWKNRLDAQRQKEKAMRMKCRTSVIANVVLLLLVILLFVISQTGKNPTILNYRTQIINQYTQWEQELSEREAAVAQKEAQLGISEQ